MYDFHSHENPEKVQRTLRPIDEIKRYTLPTLREGKVWYIEFYAFSPAEGRLKRKRIKVNRIQKTTQRRAYCKEVMAKIASELQQGWNPWVEQSSGNYATISDAIDKYEAHILKMYNSGYHRKDTYECYKSYLKNFTRYINAHPIYYLYQADKRYCNGFLDEIFVGRDNVAQTYNNYLTWLGVFFRFCIGKGLIAASPTSGIQPVEKRLIQKEREVIPSDKVKEISVWLKAHDPHFLLACYMLYYCYIRPKELTSIRIGDIKVRECVIVISGKNSKNHRTQTVTLPKQVLFYAIDLKIFESAQSDFIFSKGLKPGETPTTTKILRDHWEKMRRALGFPSCWKFYSLKDTGITEMLKHNVASLSVRDQARHSSLSITEIYAAHRYGANPELMNWRGSL